MTVDCPEALIARRLISRLGVRPPILVEDIAREFADVEELELPFDFDGISLFLKDPHRRPKVILNRNRPERRRRFTLAHELGHVLIPWHIGTIVDQADIEGVEYDEGYAILEAEANRFASEFLMPMPWMLEVVADIVEPAEIMKHVAETARVSQAAAAIKTIQCMPAGTVYAHIGNDGKVASSDRSAGTIASRPVWGSVVDPEALFADCASFRSVEANVGRYYWWTFHQSFDVDQSAPLQDWRGLLDQIVSEIELPGGMGADKFKNSINGVVSYANGRVREPNRNFEAVYSACLQRFNSKPELAEFRAHPLFNEFLRNRVLAWFS